LIEAAAAGIRHVHLWLLLAGAKAQVSPSAPFMKTNFLRLFSFFSLGLFIAVMNLACPAARAQNASAMIYQDKTAAPEKRADDLLPRLTLDEKIGLLSGDHDGFSTKAIDRLGVPKLMMSDGPQGVRNYGPACSLPSGAALASTWDVALARQYGNAIGLEARARGVHIMLGPAMNICRVAVDGRNFEYYGEDPFLAGMIASGDVQGIQSQEVISTIKHFACNNEEWDRDSVDVVVDDRTLHEIYLPAFRRCVQEAGARAVMCAYNRVDGVWCSDSDALQNQILKGQWGFKGFVMSDWGATHNVSDLPHGLDLEMPRGEIFTPENCKAALADGRWKPADIDHAVRRFLVTAFAMHFFDRPQKRADLPLESPASNQVALDVARSAIVLLKNEKEALPLDRTKIRTIAVYGRFAKDSPTHGGGSGGVDGLHPVSYLDGIRAAAGTRVKVQYVETPAPDPSIFPVMACAFLPDGKTPGLQLITQVEPNGNDKPAPVESVQSGVNLSWDDAHRPPGLPRGRRGSLEWKGVLIAPADGNWELVQNGANVKIGTPPPQYHDGHPEQWQPGDGVRLKKGEAVPISVAVDIDGGGSGNIQVGLRPVPAFDLTAAREADAVIVCVGRETSEGSDSFFEEPLVDDELIKAVAAVNPRTIVFNTSGAGLDMAGWVDRVPALLHASFLGQQAGTALGEVIFGDVNPSGHLPMTFDRSLSDNLAMTHYPIDEVEPSGLPRVHYAEGLYVGYRGYDKTGKAPLFSFGQGLSYTHFTYANLHVKKDENGALASVNVTNDGKRAGAEVVQIYIGQPGASVERPLRELKGFDKVMLKPGETRQVEIELPRDAFAYWNSAGKKWSVAPGRFAIQAGASERDIRLTTELDFK
jgi:beta-glucosidase